MLREQEPPLVNRSPSRLFLAPLKTAQRIGKGVEKPFVKIFASALLPFMEQKLVRSLMPEFPPGFEKAFGEQMDDQNTVPIIVSSHQGHADLITIMALSKKLTEFANQTSDFKENRLKGFKLLVAASIKAGHQGLLIQEFLTQTEKKYLLNGKYPLTLLDYVRPKDTQKYGMKPNSFTLTHRLIDSIRERYGIADFPEASVEGGRKDEENGKTIKGMQPIDCKNLHTVTEIVIHQGKIPVLIHVGSRGASNIVDSNLDKKSKKPANRMTLKELKALFSKKKGKLIRVKVGMPIRYDDVINELKAQGKQPTLQDISDFSGRKMAELLPENERGVYT